MLLSFFILTGAAGMPEIEVPKGVALVRSEGTIQEYRLESNGLRILLSEDHSSPVTAVMVSYTAGSRDETAGATGAAHILEHMMFKGTEKYNKKVGTQIAKVIEQTGAVINANTGYDSTNYYELVPSDRVGLALDIEASRMRGTLLNPEDFESERNVVLNELERYFDSPVVELMTAVWKEAFGSRHPYGHPVIGWRADVQVMPVEALKKFYDTYYWPGNATLTLIGDFRSPEVLEDIVLKFSPIPAAPENAPVLSFEASPQETQREVNIKKTQGVEYVLVANKIPEALHPHSAALDLLGLILSHGKTSRLQLALVEKGLAAQVEAGGSGTKEPGLFTTMATLAPGVKHDTVIEEILKVYAKMAEDGVTDDEFDRAKSQIRAEAAYARDGAMSVATELASAIGMGDWTYYAQYLSKIEKVRKKDIESAAADYLSEKTRTLGRLRMEKPTSESAGTAAGQPPSPHVRAADPEDNSKSAGQNAEIPAEMNSTGRPAGQDVSSRYYENSVRSFEQKGVKLGALRTGVKDVVAINGSLRGGGSAYHKNRMIPRLTAMMLDQGTKKRSKYEIAEQLENRGAQILFGVDSEYMRFQIRCLRRDVDAVIRLFAEEFLAPAFYEKELDTIKQQERVRLQYMTSSTSAQGLNAFLRSLFPPEHALYSEAFEEQLASLDRIKAADLKSFHEKNFAGGELIFTAAGDLDPDELWKSIREAFSDWKAQEVTQTFQKSSAQEFQGARQYAPVNERGNMDVIMGRPVSLTRKDPGFMAAYLANYLLGGDFTSRLSSIIRDQYGLTYGIRSGFVGVSEEIEGAWVIHMIVTPPRLDEGIARTLELLREFRDTKVDSEELTAKKRTVTGRFKIGLATSRELADELLNAEQWGFGPSYLDRFPGLIENVTVDQVEAAIRRYYSPDRLQITASGHLPEGSSFLTDAPKLLKKDKP